MRKASRLCGKMKNIKILHIDSNHPLLWKQLEQAGFQNEEDFTSTKEQIEAKIQNYHGIVIRSRFKIDKTFLDKATNLQFIARVAPPILSAIILSYSLYFFPQLAERTIPLFWY